MLKENYVAKQQRIGERLSRAMAKAHIDRRELAALTGYSEAQIVQWERGPVAGLVGIEGGVVSEVINLESSGVGAPDRRPRHDQQYHEDAFPAV